MFENIDLLLWTGHGHNLHLRPCITGFLCLLPLDYHLLLPLWRPFMSRPAMRNGKELPRFWMTLFGINFAIGVATGIILEFEFGTNWSNYSWFVGDIFGAPLAIEGIMAFFLESTFIAVMFFGWNKVSKKFHLVINLAGCNRSKSFGIMDPCCQCLDAKSGRNEI